MQKKSSGRKRKLPFHHNPSVETVKRSLAKTLTYRIVISILHFSVVYFVTGRWQIALGFVALSSVYSVFVFYFHDRIWDHFSWGKIDS
jgi:uncharacterized membrane protein